MFSFNGWCEFILILVVALVVIGPKDLPQVMRFLGKWLYRLQKVSREVKSHIDELVYEAERTEIIKNTDSSPSQPSAKRNRTP